MEAKVYYYSLLVGLIGAIFFGSLAIGVIYLGVTANDAKIWIVVGLLELLACTLVYYSCQICLLPAIRREIALELDDEKLQFYITDRTIYWKDVAEIFEDFGDQSPSIRFELVDGSDDIRIGTKYIRGSNKKIYNTIQEYFAQTL